MDVRYSEMQLKNSGLFVLLLSKEDRSYEIDYFYLVRPFDRMTDVFILESVSTGTYTVLVF